MAEAQALYKCVEAAMLRSYRAASARSRSIRIPALEPGIQSAVAFRG